MSPHCTDPKYIRQLALIKLHRRINRLQALTCRNIFGLLGPRRPRCALNDACSIYLKSENGKNVEDEYVRNIKHLWFLEPETLPAGTMCSNSDYTVTITVNNLST